MNKNIMKTAAKQIISVQRMLWQLDRTIFIMLVLETIIDAVLPFIGIYLSAYVLDGLTLGQSMSTLIVTSTVVVGVIFVLTLLRAWMGHEQGRLPCIGDRSPRPAAPKAPCHAHGSHQQDQTVGDSPVPIVEAAGCRQKNTQSRQSPISFT